MLPSPPLHELILFELPSPFFGRRLMEHVDSERFAWLVTEQTLAMVAVVLMSDPPDLALLLRDVQGWLALQGLTSIRFELDGRMYALESSALRAAG